MRNLAYPTGSRKSNSAPSPALSWLRLMLGNASEYYDRFGLTYLFRRFLAKAGFVRFSRRLIVIARDIHDCTHREGPLKFELATLEDIENDETLDIGFFDKRRTIYRILRGHRLFIIKENRKIQFALWIEKENAAFWWLDLPLRLPDDTAYISAIYTAPEMRNKGIYSSVKDQIYPLLRKEGITRLVGTIHPDNTLSLNIHRKFGWKEYQSITYDRLWHIRRYTVQKHDSPERKVFFAVFKPPSNIWSIFFNIQGLAKSSMRELND